LHLEESGWSLALIFGNYIKLVPRGFVPQMMRLKRATSWWWSKKEQKETETIFPDDVYFWAD